VINVRSTTVAVRLASGVNVLAGLWLVCSPWLLPYISSHISGVPFNNMDMIVGLLMVVLGLIRVSEPDCTAALSGINFALGLWTLLSAWAYGLTTDSTYTDSRILIGIVVMLFAASSTTMTVQMRAARRGAARRERVVWPRPTTR
jgi:SPW repeat